MILALSDLEAAGELWDPEEVPQMRPLSTPCRSFFVVLCRVPAEDKSALTWRCFLLKVSALVSLAASVDVCPTCRRRGEDR